MNLLFDLMLVFRELQQRDMPVEHRMVLVALADRGDRIHPSIATLSRTTGLATRTVQTCLAKLKSKGWIDMEPRDDGGRTWSFTVKLAGEAWTENDVGTRKVRRAQGSITLHGAHPSLHGAQGEEAAGAGERVHGARGEGAWGAPEAHNEAPRPSSQRSANENAPPPSQERARELGGSSRRSPALTETGRAILAAMEADYGDPPAPVMRRIATGDLAHQLAQFTCEDGHMGTRHTRDVVLAIQEIAGHERSAGVDGSGRTERELRQRTLIACRDIKRGSADAKGQRDRGPAVSQAPRRGRQVVRPGHERQWDVGTGGIGGLGKVL